MALQSGFPFYGPRGLPGSVDRFDVNFSSWGSCLRLPTAMPLSPTPPPGTSLNFRFVIGGFSNLIQSPKQKGHTSLPFLS